MADATEPKTIKQPGFASRTMTSINNAARSQPVLATPVLAAAGVGLYKAGAFASKKLTERFGKKVAEDKAQQSAAAFVSGAVKKFLR